MPFAIACGYAQYSATPIIPWPLASHGSGELAAGTFPAMPAFSQCYGNVLLLATADAPMNFRPALYGGMSFASW